MLFSYTTAFACSGYNLHYCGGHLKSVTLAQFHNAGCCKKIEKPNGCCKDVFLKCKSADQTQAKVIMTQSVKADDSYAPLLVEQHIQPYLSYIVADKSAAGDPPDILSRRLYIFTRRLLI